MVAAVRISMARTAGCVGSRTGIKDKRVVKAFLMGSKTYSLMEKGVG